MRVFRRRHRRLRCQQLVELVSDYLDGGLDPVDRTAVERHLDVCGDCRGYVAQVRRMLELTRAHRLQGLPDALLDTLMKDFRGRW